MICQRLETSFNQMNINQSLKLDCQDTYTFPSQQVFTTKFKAKALTPKQLPFLSLTMFMKLVQYETFAQHAIYCKNTKTNHTCTNYTIYLNLKNQFH